MDSNEIQQIILEEINSLARQKGLTTKKVDTSASLLKQGILDSVGLIDLLSKVENRFDIMINFTENDPETFTNVNGLVAIILNCATCKD